jgi:hypothetical protein
MNDTIAIAYFIEGIDRKYGAIERTIFSCEGMSFGNNSERVSESYTLLTSWLGYDFNSLTIPQEADYNLTEISREIENSYFGG